MDYNSMTLAELREIAKSNQMKSVTGMKKAELVAALTALDQERKSEPQKQAPIRPQEAVHKQTSSKGQDGMKKQAPMKSQESNKPHAPMKSQGPSKPYKPSKQPHAQEFRAQKNNYSEKNSKIEAYQMDTVRYESRPPKNDPAGDTKSDSQTIRSVTLEVQEAPGYEVEREKEKTEDKKPINIRNEAFTKDEFMALSNPDVQAMDSKTSVNGILEIMEGYGFIRSANYLPGESDVYVSPAQIRRFNLKTGDILKGNTRVKNQNEKFGALLYVESVNGFHPLEASKRRPFEELTPIFPDEKIRLEQPGSGIPMRIIDIIAPIGKGQRGMIVSPPKAGKTTLLKQIAKTISRNYEDVHLLVLLIDERPEEVTDIRESIEGPNVEVIYSTFDELPDHHKRVAEMVLERSRRLVEHKKDVVILLDSITRLARAYNLIVPPSGRTLTGGLDPAALHMPKKFFGAARNIREGGSLTILATALVDTGSKMDDVVFEEFKGTGNMELVLDRKLSEKRIFPAIDIAKSSTRRDDLLLTKEEQDAMYLIHRESSGSKGDETIEEVLKLFTRTKNNAEFVQLVQKSLGRRP